MKSTDLGEEESGAARRTFDICAVLESRAAERYDLYSRYLNPMMVRILRTLGFDAGFRSAQGQYLFDQSGSRYLDLLSGFGVFGIGRNHPLVRETLTKVLAGDFANLVQLDVSLLAGLLGERLLRFVPFLDRVFFANSGAEAVEAAIKFARRTTGRPGIVYCDHAFHGLTYGALSANGDAIFREGFGPLLPDFDCIPFNDLAALEKALSGRNAAAFLVEPIQGKGVNIPDGFYLRGAQALCRKYGTLFVADEIQTGLGRTGRFLAIEHWGAEPDMVLLAKTLSGGQVPAGAVLARRAIFDKVFDRMERAVVHGSTFGKNDLAMAAGLAALEVIEAEGLVQRAARLGGRLLAAFEAMAKRYELLREVRGKGLMIGIEFGPPQSMKLKAAWSLLEAVKAGLFCQLVTIPLFKDHKILCQVAGHASHTIKLLPPLIITESDCAWIDRAFDAVIADSHRVPGAIWSLGKTLAGHAMKNHAAK